MKIPKITIRNWRSIAFKYGNKYIAFDKFGVEFSYKCDSVLWIWPWQRHYGNKLISIGCEGAFKNLKEIDAFWKEYAEYCKRHDKEQFNEKI